MRIIFIFVSPIQKIAHQFTTTSDSAAHTSNSMHADHDVIVVNHESDLRSYNRPSNLEDDLCGKKSEKMRRDFLPISCEIGQRATRDH